MSEHSTPNIKVVVAGTGEAEVDYGTLLGEGVRLVVDSATRIDISARTVELASGRALDYDYVIYAVGSTEATPSVPGVPKLARASGLRTDALGRLLTDETLTIVDDDRVVAAGAAAAPSANSPAKTTAR